MRIYAPTWYQKPTKEYTVVYYEKIVGTFSQYAARYKHIETSNLADEIKDLDVAFVFEGHCTETED